MKEVLEIKSLFRNLSLFIYVLISLILISQVVVADPYLAEHGSQKMDRPGVDPNLPYHSAGFDTNSNLFSGALNVLGSKIVVPGRNGMDIVFQPSYSSTSVYLNEGLDITDDNMLNC